MGETREPEELEPHPLNAEVYVGERDEEEFVDQIEEHGIVNPLVVTEDGTIISGHRRWRAAKKLGKDEVPVRVKSYEDELAEREKVLLHNDYRDKTPAEVVNEGEAWKEVERERAKDRKKQAGGHVENLPQGEKGKTREKVGEKVGVSGKTWEKGKEVKEAANDPNAPDNVRETAEEEWEKLQSGEQSIHGAHEAVDAEKEHHKRVQRRQAQYEAMAGAVSFVDGPVTLPDLDETEVVFPLPGGKKRLAHWIISKMPPHQTYVEPFGGGASVLQMKPPSRREVYNDFDADMANFFEVLSENPEELQTRLHPVYFTEERYDEWTRPYYDGKPIDDDVKAAAVFFFSRHAQ